MGCFPVPISPFTEPRATVEAMRRSLRSEWTRCSAPIVGSKQTCAARSIRAHFTWPSSHLLTLKVEGSLDLRLFYGGRRVGNHNRRRRLFLSLKIRVLSFLSVLGY